MNIKKLFSKKKPGRDILIPKRNRNQKAGPPANMINTFSLVPVVQRMPVRVESTVEKYEKKI